MRMDDNKNKAMVVRSRAIRAGIMSRLQIKSKGRVASIEGLADTSDVHRASETRSFYL